MQDESRQMVRQAWLEAGLYNLNDPRLQSFLQHFEHTIHGCWPDLCPLVRERYAEYKEQLLTPIWDTGQKMLRLSVIQSLAPDHNDELEIFQRIIQRPDVNGNPWELEALMRVAHRRGLSG
ncbi:hypothetical protein [Dictyobacter formicarum]|uniref:Uncharacterized protein n=1 Tax=Dictyobacter formicarum TaxID=2778368 RepID=A0ABQ3VBN6_9CHLR|nr:hypothetical protein [Dictyobacter formicarum]GHO83205.1 hypothetical protein KSZ_12110 [Dictyobacter formicarum]